MLDVSRLAVMVVGGGGVAARKIAGLIDAGAGRVRVIAPSIDANIRAYNVECFEATYDASQLSGATLVFAATNQPAVNDQIVRDAQARGLLVCRADSDEDAPGDFTTPAKFSDGPVTVTVSAGSAALAGKMRDDIRKGFNPLWIRMADAMQTLRPEILASGRSIDHRRRLFLDLTSEEALDALDRGGIEALKKWIDTKHPVPVKEAVKE
jgi:precorrin-2 dehydrogenase/sirohydrochlorin ferrochelatase